LIWIPNTFTPDGDEYNNVFHPIFTSGFDPYDFNMLIFNRWGEVIFETNDAKVGWDGTYMNQLVQDGIYFYAITYGAPNSDEKSRLLGHITLIK
jgi:gliding motility-associated-like protein